MRADLDSQILESSFLWNRQDNMANLLYYSKKCPISHFLHPRWPTTSPAKPSPERSYGFLMSWKLYQLVVSSWSHTSKNHPWTNIEMNHPWLTSLIPKTTEMIWTNPHFQLYISRCFSHAFPIWMSFKKWPNEITSRVAMFRSSLCRSPRCNTVTFSSRPG